MWEYAAAWSLDSKTGVSPIPTCAAGDSKSAVFTGNLAGMPPSMPPPRPGFHWLRSNHGGPGPRANWFGRSASFYRNGRSCLAEFNSQDNDAGGNQTADTDSITLVPSSGTLLGTVTNTSVAGLATFNDISRTLAGNFTLTATSGTLSAARHPTSSRLSGCGSQIRVETTANGSGSIVPLKTLHQQHPDGIRRDPDQYGNFVANPQVRPGR